MGLGGKHKKLLSVGWTLVLSLALLLPFQNCGVDQPMSSNTNGLYQTNDDPELKDCLSMAVDCGPKSDYLQVSIDMANPLQLSNTATVLTVSGRCNTGNFLEHYIHWEVTTATGDQVSQRNEPSICIKGRYQFNINVSGLAINLAHTIKVEILGLLDGQSIGNQQAGGSAESDFSKASAPAQ